MDNGSDELQKRIELFLFFHTKKNLESMGKDLDEVDNEFQELIRLNPKHRELLFQYNEFRIANLSKLSRKRTQILTSGVAAGGIYPNVHSYFLFEMADVVCLTCKAQEYPYLSTLHCHPPTQFYEILKKLPKKFEPDFYWDNQVEHKHFIPPGIETAPFPIVASVCHTYLHKSIEHICELFDWVCPVSKFYGNILKRKYPDKILDFPFGLNWASFDLFITPCWEKTIDVCLTFAENDFAFFYNHRNRVIDMVKKFKEKYGTRFTIVIADKLPHAEYIETLRKSRIAINVTAINGPYNYRFIEAVNAGAMVFQYDWRGEFFENDFSELFIEGAHGADFNYENFENKLVYYLENPEITQKIAKDGLQFLQENYNYKSSYEKLIRHVKDTPLTLPRKREQYRGFHDLDMIYYNQPNFILSFMSYGSFDELKGTDWVRFNNLMVLSSTYAEHSYAYQLFLSVITTPLAEHEKTDYWSLCCSLHQKAKNVPQEYSWIVQWNFLLLSLEKGKAAKGDIENMIAVLQKENFLPFDENRVIFKYYVESPNYPKYQLQNLAVHEFIELNMNLMKVIDKPQERADLYRDYALKASLYFLDFFHK